jgi:hypothetical protein
MNHLVHIAAYGSPALVEAAGERAQERGPAALTQCWPAQHPKRCHLGQGFKQASLIVVPRVQCPMPPNTCRVHGSS